MAALYMKDKLNQISTNVDYIDILQLLHDIRVCSRSNSQLRASLSAISLSSRQFRHFTDFRSHDLLAFIQKTVNRRKRSLFAHRTDPDECTVVPINWLYIFAHPHFGAGDMAVISSILALYRPDTENWNKRDFRAIQLIRRHVPYTNTNTDGVDIEQLFGRFSNTDIAYFLSIDVCQQIASYLSVPDFFQCAAINHGWMRFVFRTDTFANVFFRRCTSRRSLQFVMVDQVHANLVETSSYYVAWQLRCSLDFVTCHRDWFTHYVDTTSMLISLQTSTPNDDQKHAVQPYYAWRTIKPSNDSFDRMEILSEITGELPAAALYRFEVHVNAPFEWTFYTEPRRLTASMWRDRFVDARQRDELREFWSQHEPDILFSMSDADVIQALYYIAAAADEPPAVVQTLTTEKWLTQIVRLLRHKRVSIQTHAAILLANMFSVGDVAIRAQYLQFCTLGTRYNAVHVALDVLIRTLRNGSWALPKAQYGLAKALACVVGYYVSGSSQDETHRDEQWTTIALQHRTNFVSFAVHVLRNTLGYLDGSSPDADIASAFYSFHAILVWSMSAFYRHATSDAVINEQLLSIEMSRQAMHVLFDWALVVGHAFCSNAKLNKLQWMSKTTQSRSAIEEAQKSYTSLLIDVCVCIQRIFGHKHAQLHALLDLGLTQKLVATVLDLCVQNVCLEHQWCQFLTRLALLIIVLSLREHGASMIEPCLELKLVPKLALLLHIVKTKIPNERGLVSSIKNWFQPKTNERSTVSNASSSSSPSKAEGVFMMLFEDITDIANVVVRYPQSVHGHGLLEPILEVLCIYSQREQCKESVLQHIIAYLWSVLRYYGVSARKVIMKHKLFNKTLIGWREKIYPANTHEFGPVFIDTLRNLYTVLNDENVFTNVFSCTQHSARDSIDDDEKESPENDIGCECPCGLRLQLKQAKDCYEEGVFIYCDLCYAKMKGKVLAYHCDKKEEVHRNGYDLCYHCANKRKTIQSLSGDKKLK